jgi:hypothetical protein
VELLHGVTGRLRVDNYEWQYYLRYKNYPNNKQGGVKHKLYCGGKHDFYCNKHRAKRKLYFN